jgi:hypothetical protein
MDDDAGEDDIPPPELNRFEWLWLSAMLVSVAVAILMYDFSMERVGSFLAALINIVLFGVAVLLMFLASRRRSNVARLLLIPFLLVIAFYDASHLGDMVSLIIAPYLAALRLALMAAAIYMLFTPQARAWYARRAPASPPLGD